MALHYWHDHPRTSNVQGLIRRYLHANFRSRTNGNEQFVHSRNGKLVVQLTRNLLTGKVVKLVQDSYISKVERSNGAQCTIYPLPPCTFRGLRPSYVTGIGALTTMYVGSEQCSYFAYFEQSTEHRYIMDSEHSYVKECSKSTLNSDSPPA